MICLDGLALPNELNFTNCREALTDKLIEVEAGLYNPLSNTEQMKDFLAEMEPKYPLSKLLASKKEV